MIRLFEGKLVVGFDETHNKLVGKGLSGLDIVRPDMWLHKNGDDETHTTFEGSTNHLEINPQICTVVYGSGKWRSGDKLFVHYMAYDCAEYSVTGNKDQVIIDSDFVFFKINEDGSFEMADGIYLGEPQFTAEEVTPSGIIVDFAKKEKLKIKITHIPNTPPKWHNSHPINIGDLVISIDEKNYEFNYMEGVRYIKLTEGEIAAIIKPTGIKPIAL